MTEFQNIYGFIKKVWDQEVAEGKHGSGGLDTELSVVLNIHPSAVSTAKMGKHNRRLTAQQYLLVARRFGVDVETLLRVAVTEGGG